MKLLDGKARTRLLAQIADVPTGNLLWVDPVHGDNNLAARERLNVPFETLTAAKEAAENGDTIMVLPGMYAERDLLRDGVNWHFLPGAVVRVTDTPSPLKAIFEDGGDDIVARITGAGEFLIEGSGTGSVVDLSGDDTDVLIEGQRLKADNAYCITTAGTPVCVIHAQELRSGYACVMFFGGTLEIVARKLVTVGPTWGVGVAEGTGAVVIDAFEIRNETGGGLVHSADSATLIVRNARIVAQGAAVHIASGASGKVQLMHCVGIAGTGSSHSLTADDDETVVHVPGGWTANKNVHDYVTLAPGVIYIDSTIT